MDSLEIVADKKVHQKRNHNKHNFLHFVTIECYGVDKISRLLEIIDLFCLFYTALLQERSIILRSLLIVATPYEPTPPPSDLYHQFLVFLSQYLFHFVTARSCKTMPPQSTVRKLWVSFAEYSLFYRAFLQKRPMILRSLLIVATPYNSYLQNNSIAIKCSEIVAVQKRIVK